MKDKKKSKSEAQKRAIRAYYAKKKNKSFPPDKFPFWARLKINKRRTTLVIDEDMAKDTAKNKQVEGYVHREATHTYRKDYEEVYPNPDKADMKKMYLKRPRKHPKNLFEPHNKDLNMPEHLRLRYDKPTKRE